MQKFFNRAKIKEYWKHAMESTKRKMSAGAQNLSRMIAWARGENWRGNRERKK